MQAFNVERLADLAVPVIGRLVSNVGWNVPVGDYPEMTDNHSHLY
jgi:hypothetical protein